MAEFLEDPSVLTKEKLKNELAANNVPLPSGEHKKDVYVQLYLKHLTTLNTQNCPLEFNFSSDEEQTPPLVSNRSRSGRKATRKSGKTSTGGVELKELTDEDLRQQMRKHGVDTGPIVASTRKLYEKKLQKLLDQSPADIKVLPKADSNQNGNTNSDQYSDKEDEAIADPEPEPVPVVEKPVRSRGKAPVTTRTSSRRQTKVEARDAETDTVVEEIMTEETSNKASESVIEDILANEINTPRGISATCRRPIRGAAGRPLKPSDHWLDESRIQSTVHTESGSNSESLSSAGGAVSSGKAPLRRRFLSMLLKLLLLLVVGGSLYYAYQQLDDDQINTMKGLLDVVIVPIQGVVNNAAAYLGIN